MATPNGQQLTKVVTGPVRLSYCNIFTPKAFSEDQDPVYNTVLLIPKTDKATIKKIEDAENAAKEAGKNLWGGKVPPNVKSIIHDGDSEADLEQNPEYKGCLYMSVSSKTQPGIVDRDVNPILDSTEVYSGCWARASINAYPYSHKQGGKGVSFGLNHIQKWKDGDALGGRSRAEDDFSDVYEDDEEESII